MLAQQTVRSARVLCSGYRAADVANAMEGLARSVFLPKPYRADQLLEVVGRLLDAG